MEKRQFGNTDMQVSVLGFGGAEIGFNGVEQSQVTFMLNEVLDNGCNVIDTAECYKGSEELIGTAIGHRRDDFYLFSKFAVNTNIIYCHLYENLNIYRNIPVNVQIFSISGPG